jgi:hypothetical protein
MMKKCVIITAILLCSRTALADDYFSLPDAWDKSTGTPLVLASADDDTMSSVVVSDDTFHERIFTANKLHKYLGIGSIAAAGLTLLTAPDDEGGNNNGDGGAHGTLARTAAGLGVGAVITGLLFHWDDIMLGNGISDPDNIHATLTTLGTLGYLKAVNEAPASSHSDYGAMGAVSMAIGIKMVW